MSLSDPSIKQIMDRSEQEAIEITRMFLERWKDRLNIRDIDAAAVIIQKSMEEVIHTITYKETPIKDDRLIAEFTHMIFCYVRGSC